MQLRRRFIKKIPHSQGRMIFPFPDSGTKFFQMLRITQNMFPSYHLQGNFHTTFFRCVKKSGHSFFRRQDVDIIENIVES